MIFSHRNGNIVIWLNFNHWLHWKLSKWQLPVQPVFKIEWKWQHFCFGVMVEWSHLCQFLSKSGKICKILNGAVFSHCQKCKYHCHLVNFLPSTQKIHLWVSYGPYGWAVGCILWVKILTMRKYFIYPSQHVEMMDKIWSKIWNVVFIIQRVKINPVCQVLIEIVVVLDLVLMRFCCFKNYRGPFY